MISNIFMTVLEDLGIISEPNWGQSNTSKKRIMKHPSVAFCQKLHYWT